MKYFAIILIYIVIITSCSIKRDKHIIKFIYFGGQDICYDSLDNPHLSIRKYFEFDDNQILIATGHRFSDSIAPEFGLDRFYKITLSDSVSDFLDKILINKSFDTVYQGDSHSPWYYYFTMTTSDNQTTNISFSDSDRIPKELNSLHSYISSFFNSTKLIKTDPFFVDKTIIQIENDLFKRQPPPRRVPKGIEKVRYTAPDKHD
jgi:hypothetical protein